MTAVVLTSGGIAAGLLPAVPSIAATPAARAYVAITGLTLRSVTPVDGRMTDYTFTTPALPAVTHLRVTLPAGYASHPATRYPVLYLLHGCCSPAPRQAIWTDPGLGDAERLTANDGVITVTPDGDLGSMFTDWSFPGVSGQWFWETYFVRQLIPWIDGNFRTVADHTGRAIAGVSMGGYGAAAIAARHPDLFAAVASFSGFPDTNVAPADFTNTSKSDGGLAQSLWGARSTDAVSWHGHNPTDLAMNLRGVAVQLASGNGLPGPLPDPNTGAAQLYFDRANERNVLRQTSLFAAALKTAGVPYTFDAYGNGLHVWPYWRRDLQQWLPTLMAVFAAHTPPPTTFSFTAVEPTFSAWGYTVAMTRKVAEFATLTQVTAQGFALSGSGAAVVTTVGRYLPGHQYRISVTTAAGRLQGALTADAAGRLTIPITLGAANTVQQYLPVKAGTRVTETAKITIAAG